MRGRIGLAAMVGLASCVPAPHAPAPVSRPVPPVRPAIRETPAYPDAPERLDWRDVPLTPGLWTWQGHADGQSASHYGVPGGAAVLVLRCDFGRRIVSIARSGSLGGTPAAMTVTTSFGTFAVPARDAEAGAPTIVAELAARDPRLDQLAFSRGRFLIDVPGQPRLVVPSWPEAARVIEDCRGGG